MNLTVPPARQISHTLPIVLLASLTGLLTQLSYRPGRRYHCFARPEPSQLLTLHGTRDFHGAPVTFGATAAIAMLTTASRHGRTVTF